MTIDVNDLPGSILESLSHIDYLKSQDLPGIELYMDQVTTFMDSHLGNSKRHPDDKILTKTMINNYAKNNLLPPPNKKKYSKEHLLTLIFIYYFKNILSISDIQAILNPITDTYFGTDSGFNLETIYDEVFHMEPEEIEGIKADILNKYEKSQNVFSQTTTEDQEFLQTFAFICLLSFDVYLKKSVIENLIDSMTAKKLQQQKEKEEKAKELKEAHKKEREEKKNSD